MKEQILTLEATDDLHSLRDKIARAQAGRLVLLWPALRAPISRRLDLVLMKRWALQAGSELVVVSADDAVRSLARRAGVRAYPTLAASALAGLSALPAAPAPPSFVSRRKAPPRHPPDPRRPLPPALRIACFGAAALAVAAVFLLLVPSARLRAAFPSREVEASGPLDTDLCADLTVRLTLSERRTTNGRILAPTAYASGEVRLTNTSSRTQTLPPGVRISSAGGILFETVAGIILAPGQSAVAAVRAVEPGSDSNLPAGGIDSVLGPLSLSITAENAQPLSGGRESWRSAVAAEDIEYLRDTLSGSARREALASFQNLAGEGRMLAEGSLRMEFDPLDAPDHPADTPADSVGLTLHAMAAMTACPTNAVRQRAEDLLQARTKPGEILSDGSVELQLAETDEGVLELSAAGILMEIPDRNAMSLALRARTPDQAVSLLEDRFGAVAVREVDLSPEWLPVLPLFPFRIEIVAEAG